MKLRLIKSSMSQYQKLKNLSGRKLEYQKKPQTTENVNKKYVLIEKKAALTNVCKLCA